MEKKQTFIFSHKVKNTVKFHHVFKIKNDRTGTRFHPNLTCVSGRYSQSQQSNWVNLIQNPGLGQFFFFYIYISESDLAQI